MKLSKKAQLVIHNFIVEQDKENEVVLSTDDIKIKTELAHYFKLAPRFCDCCGKGMWKGFCIDGGLAYYCTKKCLKSEMTYAEFVKLHDNGNGNSYWTTWEEYDLEE